MKKLLLIAAIAVIALTGCKKKDDTKPQPKTPVITINTQPQAKTVTEGSITDNLSVVATVTESATLSYQWFKNTAANNTGGTAVGGATGATFLIPTDLTAALSPYYYFCEVKATGGATAVRSNAATVTVNPAAVEPGTSAPVLTTAEVTAIYATMATAGGNITDEGTPPYTERGVCYATTQNPTVANFKLAVAGEGTGAFTASLSGLEGETTYYVRAYATNSAGTAYGNEVSFTTRTLPPSLTSTVYDITATSATAGGNIGFTGAPPYTERGVCYATTENPTVDDIKIVIAGTGTGSFSTNLTGLTENTKYYVRSYAISSIGTFYGNEVSFTTSSAPPFAGSGTSADPYQIGTAEQLAQLAELVNAGNADYNSKYYILTADIDLDVAPYNEGKGWIPIGRYDDNYHRYIFSGNFDGNGKKISGLYINDNNLNRTGLFGLIEGGGVVKNLGVVDVNITGGRSFTGGVAGYASNISNCYTSGVISGESTVGGVAGFISGSLINCYSSSIVSGSDNVGGVVGLVYFYGSAINSYSTGAVRGRDYVGGVVGAIQIGYTSNCVALNSSVEGTSEVGRVVGWIFGDVTLTGNAALNSMTVNGSTVTSSDGTSIDGEDINATQTKERATYETKLGWDFTNVWKIEEGVGYPKLIWE